MSQGPLRIGFVPEHFSTPLHFAQKYYGLHATLIPFPSGTGHMVTAIRAGEIDVAIGLTEGWIAGLGKETVESDDGGYRLVGTYVETPLCWAISTGAGRPDITSISSLKGGKIGVSRIGSGSYVMGYVLADQQGWLAENASFSDTVVLHDFEKLRGAVNSGEADFFMWEHFTSKKYYDSGEIRRVGEIYTPWSSWKIVASTKLAHGTTLDARVKTLFAALDHGVKHFEQNPDEAVAYISTELGYTEPDAREWLKTVRFPSRTEGVKDEVVENCVAILRKAGVLVQGKGLAPESMVLRVTEAGP
ncbi:hypothetical protein AAL_02874 [Moelleriella libera RCEF 2490]|uniref:Ca3427-like PBP 2 domain-containing protein n=1 Tax=Moelleriella libera RCEF 2490 TaxID=1081109 RepID=A0A168E2P6_9HYPO|nr:hypothetical protein AAL_02874 [Moelleriella libera RCEF 2490]